MTITIHLNFFNYFNISYSYMFNIKDESYKIEKCVPKLLILMNNYDNYVKKIGGWSGWADHDQGCDQDQGY